MSTWEDIEREADQDPVLHAVVHRVYIGDCTREQALIEAVLVLSHIRVDLVKQVTDLLMHGLPPIVLNVTTEQVEHLKIQLKDGPSP